MVKERLPFRSAFFIFSLFSISSNAIVGFPWQTGQDTWFAMLLTLVPIVPLYLMLARMVHIMPQKNLFDMAEYALGKAATKAVCVSYCLYSLIISTLSTFNFGTFVHLTSLYRTNFCLIVMLFFLAGLYLAKSGVVTLGKCSGVTLFFMLATLIFLSLASIPKLHFQFLQPVLRHSPRDLLDGAREMTFISFGEIVLTLCFADAFDKGTKARKLYLGSLSFSFIYLLLVFLRIICLMGPNNLRTVVFQNYRSATLIRISDFFERIEALIGFVYMLAGISRLAVCLICASKAAKKLLNVKSSYRSMTVPLGFFVCACAISPFDGIVDMTDFADNVYPYLAFVFQFLLPVVIWIAAEVRHRKKKKANPLSQIEEEISRLVAD